MVDQTRYQRTQTVQGVWQGCYPFFESRKRQGDDIYPHLSDETILVVANLSRFSQWAELDLKGFKEYVPQDIFSQTKFPMIGEAPYQFTLSPYAYYWLLLKKSTVGIGTPEVKELMLDDAEQLLNSTTLAWMDEEILPSYFSKCAWFAAQRRTPLRFVNRRQFMLPVNDKHVFWIIVEVNYDLGEPEYYQLPVAFAFEEKITQLKQESPAAVICPVRVGRRKEYCMTRYIQPNSGANSMNC
jgi:maltose alpha-D-glucosyltransferase/alpha-amylase